MFWSIIAANKRKTVLLIVLMGALLAALGYLLGVYLGGDFHPLAGWAGLLVAALVWLAMLAVSLTAADDIFLHLAGAHEVDRQSWPQLHNVVEEMQLAAGMHRMPRIFVMDDPSPNAFAVGRSPADCAVCVTAGLLALCNRDELQGVVAHEIGHIINRDILYMTVAATTLGATCFLSDIFLRNLRFSGGRRYRSRSRKGSGGRAGGYLLIMALLLAIFGPLFSRLLYFSASRKREYLADATSARLTRYPAGLAAALEKMRRSPARLTTAPSATAPFYIVNPYRPQLSDNAFATHPPLERRIGILKGMAGGAGYGEYLKSYRRVTGSRRALIRGGDLNRSPLAQKVDQRGPQAQSVAMAANVAAARKRSGDIIRAVNGFAFIPCACGMQIKVPPDYAQSTFTCPRCGAVHRIPEVGREHVAAILAAAAAMSAGRADKRQPQASAAPGSAERKEQVVARLPGQWQGFDCSSCGRHYQLSPAFRLRQLSCSRCGNVIRVE